MITVENKSKSTITVNAFGLPSLTWEKEGARRTFSDLEYLPYSSAISVFVSAKLLAIVPNEAPKAEPTPVAPQAPETPVSDGPAPEVQLDEPAVVDGVNEAAEIEPKLESLAKKKPRKE